MSCLGTGSSPHSLSLIGRRGGGWQHRVLDGLAVEKCQLLSTLHPWLGNESLSSCCWAHVTPRGARTTARKEGSRMHPPTLCAVPTRAPPGRGHGGTTRTLGPGRSGAEAMGATRKRLSPSQRCVEQAGTSWGWGELFGGQPGTSNPGDLQTHPRSPGSQADRRKHPQPPPSSPVGPRRDVFPGAVLLTLPQLPAPSPRGGQVFALLPGNGAGAKLAKI